MHSVWTETAVLPRFDHPEGDLQTDVLVIGGGMAGILCARKLKDAGIDCIVAEADRICSGITKNTTAKITAQHGLIYQRLLKQWGTDTARLYLQANLDAVAEFRRLAGGTDCDFQNRDSYVYTVDDRQILTRELEALARIGSDAAYSQTAALPFPTAGAVLFRNQAQFHPLKFISAICQDLNICENTRVTGLNGTHAQTPYGTIRAKKVIVATHFPFLNRHGGYFLKLYQHRSYVLALCNAQTVEGMYVDGSGGGLSLRCHDGLLLLGGGGHRTGKSGGGWRELEAFAQAHYLGALLKYRWATQDCMSLDGIPYIGRYSRSTPDVYVATGFNKWGMTSSMVAAELLTKLISGEESPLEAVFSPSRRMLRPQLAVNGWESALNLLTPSAKRCPHMGCALKWNPRERSWDCPCHGSRFSEDGSLIDNPATGDLDA